MTLDIDLELRLAVFEHVRRLRDQGGGGVSWRALNEGMLFHGERVPIRERDLAVRNALGAGRARLVLAR